MVHSVLLQKLLHPKDGQGGPQAYANGHSPRSDGSSVGDSPDLPDKENAGDQAGKKAHRKPMQALKDLFHRKKHKNEAQREAQELDDRISPQLPAATSPTAGQGEDEVNTTNNNLTRMVGCNLLVQVLAARGVRAADLNGFSDPYCVVKVAGQKAQTRIILKSLNPNWNETFCFEGEDLDFSLLADNPVIKFEVWDSDAMTADDFLGKARLDLAGGELPMAAGDPQWLALCEHRAHATGQTDLGRIQVAAWLEHPKDSGRIKAGSMLEERTKLSTLVTPPGVSKHLPTVMHTGGNVLYEAPCVAFLRLHLGEVRDIDSLRRKSSPSPTSASRNALLPPTYRKRNLVRQAFGMPPIKASLLPDRDSVRETIDDDAPCLTRLQSLGRSTNSMDEDPQVDNMEDDDGIDWDPFQDYNDDSARQDERDALNREVDVDGESEAGSLPGTPQPAPSRQLSLANDAQQEAVKADSSDGEYTASPPRLRTISEDMDDIQAPGQEDRTPQSSGKAERAYVYLRVTMRNQVHMSRMTQLHAGVGRWQQDLMFALAMPMKDRPIKLELFSTPSRKQRGRLVAHAFIPLSDLLPFDPDDIGSPASLSTPENSCWFRLHAEHRLVGSDSSRDAALKLTLTAVDSDTRRHMYKLAWMGPTFRAAVEPSGRATSQALSEASTTPLHTARSGASHVSSIRDSAASVKERSQSVGSGSQDLRLQLRSQAAANSPQSRVSRWLQWGSPQAPSRDFRSLPAQPMRSDASSHSREVAPDEPSSSESPQSSPQPAGLWPQWSQHSSKLKQLLTMPKGRGGDGKTKMPSSARPIGTVKLVLEAAQLPSAVSSFAVLKCGPHWGSSTTVPNSSKPTWNWEVHLPLYDPSSLLLLCVFSEPHKRRRPVTHRLTNPIMLGKLRLRLSTLAPGKEHPAVLPMLPPRSSKLDDKSYMRIRIKVDFTSTLSMLRAYASPALPRDLYRNGMHHNPAQRLLEAEQRRITLRWLECSHPPIPKAVTTAVLDSERNNFTMSRAKANWRRIKIIKDKFSRFSAWLAHVKRWDNPWESVGAMSALGLLCFAPHIVVSLALIVLVVYALSHFQRKSGEPLPMEEDPEAEGDDNDPVTDSGPYSTLKAKYDKLQRIALAVQNVLDDLASNLERLQACVNATDPSATLLFVFVVGFLGLLIGALGFPTVLCIGLCWQVRPPFLRTPTPPPPVSFFKRLPCRADQIR